MRLEGSVRSVWINDELVLYNDWFGTREIHEGVKVWVGDTFEWASDALIKNVKWTNLSSIEPEPLPEWDMSGGDLLLGNTWFQAQSGH